VGADLYIVRTWDYYLEFLSPKPTRARVWRFFAKEYGIPLAETAAFGDANNDIPLFKAAHTAIAVKNASPEAKRAATRVSEWTNDEDAVAREWERLKGL